MEKKTANNDFSGKNLETRHILDKYYSVQFSIDDEDPLYMFKLRGSSYYGLCILVKEDSDVLKFLKVNETISMEYNPSASKGKSKFLKTRISNIAKNDYEGFSGHCLVGLSIIEEHDGHS